MGDRDSSCGSGKMIGSRDNCGEWEQVMGDMWVIKKIKA